MQNSGSEDEDRLDRERKSGDIANGRSGGSVNNDYEHVFSSFTRDNSIELYAMETLE